MKILFILVLKCCLLSRSQQPVRGHLLGVANQQDVNTRESGPDETIGVALVNDSVNMVGFQPARSPTLFGFPSVLTRQTQPISTIRQK